MLRYIVKVILATIIPLFIVSVIAAWSTHRARLAFFRANL